jgi:hypothetical protein
LGKLKKILIIYPHFPPSNLAGVHRPRLFAQHLNSFGWEPVILTVDEKFYEETLDWNLHQLLPKNLRIEKVNAFKITKPRLIGDIGLRAFFQLRKKALSLLQSEEFDFIYIPIPSFYTALLGPYLYKKTKVKYGIDYIDPWVHVFPGSDKLFSRHWFTTQLAKWLEPKAVKNVAVITGVAEGYYQGVIERNPSIKNTCLFGAMPYGGEKSDHEGLRNLDIKPYLFQKNNKLQLVYAGAMLPKAYEPLEAIFKAIAANKAIFNAVEFHFIGTGKLPNDPLSYNIKPLAEKYGLWQTIVFEYPKRIPYLDVLIHLDASDGVFILGSTEPHYTPSKTYQGVLSCKPILAVLHQDSSAVKILKSSGGGIVLDFDGQNEIHLIENNFPSFFSEYINWIKGFNIESVDLQIFEQYSAKNVTQKLVSILDKINS